MIKHADGYSAVFLDQRGSPGWRPLGVFNFDAESNLRLVVPNYFQPSRRPVIADAVRFTRVANK